MDHPFRYAVWLRVVWGVLYGIHPIVLNHDTKHLSQNSGALSLKMVLGSQVLANIVLNICLRVVAYVYLTFITSAQLEKESTQIKNKPMSRICSWSIWTLVHIIPSLGHLCIFICLNVLISGYLGHLLMISIVEGEPKAPFSIASTPRCTKSCYSFPWTASLYPWSITYNAEY